MILTKKLWPMQNLTDICGGFLSLNSGFYKENDVNKVIKCKCKIFANALIIYFYKSICKYAK